MHILVGMPQSLLHAPGSGRPFENVVSGLLLAHGFIVDIDLLWVIAGQGELAQFDCVASAGFGRRIQRIIVECKGGDRWGYADAFQLLGQLHFIGRQDAILFVAYRLSTEQNSSRTPDLMDGQLAPSGLHVLSINIDDRIPGYALFDVEEVAGSLFHHGFMAMKDSGLSVNGVEACIRGVARLRGAMSRVAETLVEPMSPYQAPAATLLAKSRDWALLAGDPRNRFTSLQEILASPNISQIGWNPEVAALHPHFGRDVSIVELYVAAQAVAALCDTIRAGGDLPKDLGASREFRKQIGGLDLHAIVRAAYILSVVSPWSSIAEEVRHTHGAAVAELAVSKRLRRRCRDLGDRHGGGTSPASGSDLRKSSMNR